MKIEDLKIGSKYYLNCRVEYIVDGKSPYTEKEIHIAEVLEILGDREEKVLVDCPKMGGLQLISETCILSEVIKKKEWWEFWK